MDDDDLYDGFGDDHGIGTMGFNRMGGSIPGTSLGRGPPTTSSRLMTASGTNNVDVRPVTSNQGAGYTSTEKKQFNPLNQRQRINLTLEEKAEKTPEETSREIEIQVHTLLEESAILASKRDLSGALDKAKEAVKRERLLCKHKDMNKLSDQISHELSLAVNFNLAHVYQQNGMYAEATKLYESIVKNKSFPLSGRMRVNIGDMHFAQNDFHKAIRMYRMALDQIPNTGKRMRFRIMRNIGVSFVKLGQFEEAITNFEAVMVGDPDHQTGFNLIICNYALGDVDQMKKSFEGLLEIPIPSASKDDEEDDISKLIHEEEDGENNELKVEDDLTIYLQRHEAKLRKYLLDAARLIAPVLDKKDWIVGYDWVIARLADVQPQIASEMEINKSMEYLKNKRFDKATEVLKAFEKKDQHLKAKAATNLSFLYFLEGDLATANKYANLAVRHDRYNAKALVNKGNCLFVQDELERAKELFLEAIGVEADCSEAIFNLGLVNQRMGLVEESLQAFEKLHSIIPNSPEVIYQIANLYDILGNFREASKWFNILISRVPTDANVLARMGQLCIKEDDENQALHFHHESYRYYPVNLDVISWLGVWYVKNELYEKAIEFFLRAAQIQPTEVKWKLMVTSCYRRMGSYQKALHLYEEIHSDFPENVECLRYLVAISKDLGLPFEQYQIKLGKLDSNPSMTMTAAAPTRFADYDEDERKSAMIDRVPQTIPDNHKSIIKNKGNEDDWADADIDDLLAE